MTLQRKGSTPGPIEPTEPAFHGITSVTSHTEHPSAVDEKPNLPTCDPSEQTLADKDWTPSPEDGNAKPHHPAGEEAPRSSSESSSSDTLPGDGFTYPEGGWKAWGVVLGAFTGMTASFGMMNSIGIFQAYISTNQLSHYDDSTVGWIFSIYTFLSFFCGIQIGPIFDAYGPRMLILAGNICLIASMMLLSVCKEYYQFLLTFGVLGGIGTSLIFTPAISSIGHFFQVKRAAATGLASGGGSIGGIIFPLMLQSLIPKVGWGWAVRILGFIFVFLGCVAQLLIRSRLPPKPGGSVLPDFRIFSEIPFTLTTAGVFFMEWGLFIPITYITSYALSTGAINETFSYQLIAILNTGSCLGRWAPGFVADRLGRFNCMVTTLTLCFITTIALWLPDALLSPLGEYSDNKSAIKGLTIAYALLFGFASGTNISLTPVCVGQLCTTQTYGRYYATCYTIVSFGTLTGIPIAGALLSTTGGRYWGMVVFTFATYMCAWFSFLGARVLKVGWTLDVRY